MSSRSRWSIAAAFIWGVALIILLLRAGLHPARATSLTTYLAGGDAWSAGREVYTNWRGFVYPPPIAAFFGLLTHLPLAVTAVAWRAVTAGGLLAGLGALLRCGAFPRIPPRWHGLVFVGMLPLCLGNVDNAQANPLVAGLMMLGVAAFQWEAWTLCALAAGLAAVFKIYPVALALLLCVRRPRELPWRLILVVALLTLLPFALQSHGYVGSQYHAWLQTRLNDDRTQYPVKDAPLDFWFLLAHLGHFQANARTCNVTALLTGAALAAYVWWQARRENPPRQFVSRAAFPASSPSGCSSSARRRRTRPTLSSRPRPAWPLSNHWGIPVGAFRR